MNRSLYNQLRLKPSTPIELAIGSTIHSVEVFTDNVENNCIFVSESLLKSFDLPIKNYRLQAHLRESILYLGPIISIVTEISERNGIPHFRSIHAFCEELQTLVDIYGGLLYIFSLPLYPKHTIVGWYYDGQGWKTNELPLPNVVYNRIHSRKLESSNLFSRFKQYMNLLHIPLFNDGYISKWSMHSILHRNESLRSHVPETELFNREQLLYLLSKYGSVYLKPINGSQGKNILLLRQEMNDIALEPSTPTHMKRVFKQCDEFLNWFHEKYDPLDFIVQQAIPLITYNARQLDFRLLCHKNLHGKWKVTSIVSRASAEGLPVSNLAQGGELHKPHDVLEGWFDKCRLEAMITSMKSICLQIAKSVSDASNGYVGELGIDMGIDQEGYPWIIEVNIKPSKNTENESNSIRPSTKAIFEYATSLSFHHVKNSMGG